MPYNEIVEVNSNNLTNELNELPLAGNILPGPGTKVTTTVSVTRMCDSMLDKIKQLHFPLD